MKSVVPAAGSSKIVVDGVCFEWEGAHGIPRVWTALLEHWSGTSFAQSLVVLDRNGTAPKFDHIQYENFRSYNEENAAEESFILQDACNLINATLFISTHHTTPIDTPSALLVHDMIPERWPECNKAATWVLEKNFSTFHAVAYLSISHNTARELKEVYPFTANWPNCIAHNGISPVFHPASLESIAAFKQAHNITKPYFLCVGGRGRHKNVELFFGAFAKLADKHQFTVICCGGDNILEPQLQYLAEGCDVRRILLSDADLVVAYSGALALVFPSVYEGFGLPVVEAMASGCPVIACPTSSIPEVAGDAALFVAPTSVEDMRSALIQIQVPDVRKRLIGAGLERSKLFSWHSTADTAATFLAQAAERGSVSPKARAYQLWRQFRNCQTETNTFTPEMMAIASAYAQETWKASAALPNLERTNPERTNPERHDRRS